MQNRIIKTLICNVKGNENSILGLKNFKKTRLRLYAGKKSFKYFIIYDRVLRFSGDLGGRRRFDTQQAAGT